MDSLACTQAHFHKKERGMRLWCMGDMCIHANTVASSFLVIIVSTSLHMQVFTVTSILFTVTVKSKMCTIV